MEGPFNLAVSLFTLTSKICLIRRDQTESPGLRSKPRDQLIDYEPFARSDV